MVNRILKSKKYNIFNMYTGKLGYSVMKCLSKDYLWMNSNWYPIYDSRGEYLGYMMYKKLEIMV